MNIEKEIKKLYAKIPEFECLEGCTGCCGPVPFSKWEWDRIKDKRKATGFDCPYINCGKCEIYDKRPLLCRLFGTVEDLRCPYGRRPDKLLSKKEGQEIMNRYFELMKTD